jgi:WD40 repeat protein
MRRTNRPRQFRSGQEKWKERVIILGNSGNDESGNVTSLMTLSGLVVRWAPTPLAACALVERSGLSMVRVFDLGTGAVQGQARLPSGKISGLSLTSDGSRLLVHMESGVVLEGRFTDFETLREHPEIERMGQPEPPPEVASLSQPQKSVRATIAGIWMVACADGSIWRWAEGTKDNPRRINAPGPKVHALAITPDGNVAVSAGEGRGISFWRGEKRIAQVGGHAHRATHACICDDATKAVTAGQDGTLIVWNLRELTQSSGCAFRSEITALREFADRDGRRHAISGDLEGSLRLHTTLGTGESGDHTWQAHAGRVRDLAVTPLAIHAISAGDGPQGSARRTGGSVAIWDITSRACLARYESTREIWAIAVSPCGKHLAAATNDCRLLVWDLASVLRDSSFELGLRGEASTPDNLRALVFSETNHLFAAGNTSGKIYSWSVGGDDGLAQSFSMAHDQESESCLDQGDGAKQTGAYALALSSCGQYLACSGRGRHRAISIWKTAAPAELVSVLFANRAGSLRGTHSLAFVRDTKQLWSANWDGSVVRWDWSEKQGRCLLYQPAADVSVMVASASGEHLLLGTAQGEVRDMELVNPDLLLAGLPYV